MSEKNTLCVVVTFDAAADFEDGDTIVMRPSRPGKAEALAIGWAFYEASEPEQDALLAECGPVLVRRSLRVFANYAKRDGQREVADYAEMLRDEITVVRGEADDSEAAS